MAGKLFVFDMDGVLLDSEPYHTRAHQVLYNQMVPGAPLPLPNTPGRSVAQYYRDLLLLCRGKAATEMEVADWRRRHFETLAGLVVQDAVPATQGLYTLLDVLEQKRYAVGVASSSDRYYVDAVLHYLGIQNRVCYTACGDEVPCTKPAPDVYLALLANAGAAAGQALALEDSAAGMQAAVAAGIRCIGFVPGGGQTPAGFAAAHAVVHTLRQVEALL